MTKRRGSDPSDDTKLIDAAESGDRLQTLIALRDLLAERLQHTESSRDIASMSRRLMQCVAEIEAIEKQRSEQRPFSLQELRKRTISEKKRIDRQYSLNRIEVEHERN